MKVKYLLFYVMLLSASLLKAQEKSSISGTVVDEKHLTLPGATVFLTSTKSITVCDNNGKFSLPGVVPGNYELVVKMMGFEPYVKPIKLGDKPLVVNVQLKPNAQVLKEVKIRPDYDRVKHLAIFKKQFLGETYNAKECKLLNPDVLYFNYDKGTKSLIATADEFLSIQNTALGYTLKYLLTNFEYNEDTRVVSFQGYPSFVEMKGTPKQEASWAKKRREAYLGSINHFIRSIYNVRVQEEGFNVYKLLNRPVMGIQKDSGKDVKQIMLVQEPVAFDSLVTVSGKDLKSLSYKDCLYVIYKHEKLPDNYVGLELNVKKVPTADIAHNGQVSLVYLLTDKVDLDGQGLFTPTNGLFFEGYWAWEKNADLMPLEYTAKFDEKENK